MPRDMSWVEKANELRAQGLSYVKIGKIVERSPAAVRVQLNSEFKARVRIYSSNWYRKNSEKVKARSAIWADNNPGKVKESKRAWRSVEENRNKEREKSSEWKKSHPEKVVSYTEKHRALKVSAKINDLTDLQWVSILCSYDGHCCYCGCTNRKLTQDHIQPLIRDGNNTASNVVPACGPCNSSKGTKTLDEWIAVGGYPLHPPYIVVEKEVQNG